MSVTAIDFDCVEKLQKAFDAYGEEKCREFNVDQNGSLIHAVFRNGDQEIIKFLLKKLDDSDSEI